MNRKSIALATVSALALGGCQMSNEQIATTLGAVGGAAAGTMCRGDLQGLCIAGGAAVGAWLGNQIGKKLDERDRERHAQATAQVLAQSSAQTSSSWTNPDNGTSGTVRVVSQRQTEQTTKVPVLKDKVEEVMPLELIGEVYSTDRNVNVRVGPGTDYRIVPPGLQNGDQFNVVGRVIERPDWLMIADLDSGVGSGYVFAPLVQSSGIAAAPKQAATGGNVEQVSVAALQQCKTVTHEIAYQDGTTDDETVEMCQRGDGSWDIV